MKVLGKDGWMHTGDTAVITEAGYGKIVGRMKDMIIRGGENIYPRYYKLAKAMRYELKAYRKVCAHFTPSQCFYIFI